MRHFFTTTLLIALFTISATASSKIYQGYVILNDDTKIEGSITMLSPALNEVRVKFTSKDGQKKVYKSKDVKEYSFQVTKWNDKTRTHDVNDIIYTRQTVQRPAIAFGSTEVLLERQITGSINMYNHFIEQNTNPNQPFAHIIYVEKDAGTLIPINKSNYKMILKEMTREYPELSARVGTRGYGHKYTLKIINTFNHWMLENGEEVVLDMD